MYQFFMFCASNAFGHSLKPTVCLRKLIFYSLNILQQIIVADLRALQKLYQ